MTPRPLVSVVMNCYNGETYLRQAIDSVVAQTYDRWEIVFWDNQSTDASADIAQGYGDERIKYFRAPTHTPLYSARNHAIERCTGELVAFLDVDDWWTPSKLARQAPLFEDADVGFAAGHYWIESEVKRSRWPSRKSRVPTGHVLDDLLRDYYVGLLTLVVRRSALAGLDYVCDPRFSIIGDFDLVIRLAMRWKLGYVQDLIAHYRLHANNLQRKFRTRHAEECDLWLEGVGRLPTIRSSAGFAGFSAELAYSKALNELLDGSRWQAFRLSRRVPMGRFKARLWAALLAPDSLIHRLKN